MKPWEETWEAEIWMHDGQQRPIWCVQSNHKPDKLPDPIFEMNEADGLAHAKLAAAAPEMARLLLDIVQAFEEGCSAGEVGDRLASTLNDSTGVVTVLKKAGVLGC